MRVVDLRSDTVTLPTAEMLQAMDAAVLGDDVYREDPTVNRLEEIAAKKLGKEAALLTTSGTQANLVSVLSHTKRGEEVILESDAHMYYYESGAFTAFGGLIPRLVKGERGVVSPEEIKANLRPPNLHFPTTSLVCIENTHNRAGGTVWTPSQIRAVCDLAHEKGLKVHMDGARIFNAAVAQNIPASELAQHVDSMMFCLSKGLSAPVGSVAVGDRAFIDTARRYRKMLGGGMRQAGVIAAAGIIAIEKMVDRLQEDHYNAKVLAKGLASIDGIAVDMTTVQTNIVVHDVSGLGASGERWVAKLGESGVKAGALENNKVRLVTHRGIEKDDIEYTLNAAERGASELAKR